VPHQPTREPDVAERAAIPMRFTSFQPISPAATRQWKRTIEFFNDTLAQGEAAAHPLVRGSAARMVAASALATFPNTALQTPTGRDERDATSATVRRAVRSSTGTGAAGASASR
jgi:hypothetical protein